MDGVAKDNTPSLSRSLTQSLTGLLKTRESNRTQHKALVASGSIVLAALSARSRAEAGTDRESFGWWRLETSSSGDESKQGSHGLELRVNVIEARDLVSSFQNLMEAIQREPNLVQYSICLMTC